MLTDAPNSLEFYKCNADEPVNSRTKLHIIHEREQMTLASITQIHFEKYFSQLQLQKSQSTRQPTYQSLSSSSLSSTLTLFLLPHPSSLIRLFSPTLGPPAALIDPYDDPAKSASSTPLNSARSTPCFFAR